MRSTAYVLCVSTLVNISDFVKRAFKYLHSPRGGCVKWFGQTADRLHQFVRRIQIQIPRQVTRQHLGKMVWHQLWIIVFWKEHCNFATCPITYAHCHGFYLVYQLYPLNQGWFIHPCHGLRNWQWTMNNDFGCKYVIAQVQVHSWF